MLASIPSTCLNVSSTSSRRSLLGQPQTQRSLKIPRVRPQPEKPPPFRETCARGCLKGSFKSLSSLITHASADDVGPVEAFSQILELCAAKEALVEGQQVHAHLAKSSYFGFRVFLSTKLVFMYGRCGSCRSAEKLFARMRERTVYTWNAMIGAYLADDDPAAALELYRDMRLSGLPLDSRTFPSVLKACAMLRDRCSGAEIHGFAIKCGFASLLFVVNSLVAMYAKCNDLDGARQLFNSTDVKEDLALWNSIICAYSAGALQACQNLDYQKLGMEIHAAILKSGNEIGVHVGNALIAMYVRCGEMNKAARVFFNLVDRDSVSWNSMLSGLVQNGLHCEALQLFRDMQDFNQEPDTISIMGILTASGRLANLLHGRAGHGYVIRRGLDSNLQVGNTLMDMYAKCCMARLMGRVFYCMPVKDIISWTTIIAGYSQNDCHMDALKCFREVQTEGMDVDKMLIGSALLACGGSKSLHHVKEIHSFMLRRGLSDLVLQNRTVDAYGACGHTDYASQAFELIENKDVISWTSLISCYVHNGLAQEAFQVFLEMKDAGIEVDYVALVSVLSAATDLSLLQKGKEIHGSIIRRGFILEGSVSTSLVDMYARCGDLENACKVFSSIDRKDLSMWTTMIYANGMHGRGRAAIDLFKRMIDTNLVPDHITFLAILYSCSHSGLINEGKTFFTCMQHDYQLEPWSEHYACLVDLLGRGNSLDEAYEFIKSMPIEPTAEVWCSLLGACRVHSDKKLGEIAVHKLLELNPDKPGNYVLVSNILAANGRWKDVKEMRMRMKGIGFKKTPGCSWIELGNKIHSFVAGDKSHPQSDKIYQKLAEVTDKLVQEGGYVAQTRFVLHDVGEEEKLQMLYGHSERLAIAYSLLESSGETPIRVTKNLRVCGDCHTFCKLVSKCFGRELIVRDASRFHHFNHGVCSCGDFW
ncbi:pentatricopeptide repeat-containing protein At3g63370, chloroplastic isoform X2 [Rhodamnia argentea]|uniref:Pentatricopeptide repeat-containing protein At3g63370, chloroplastic isoform X2 n=1 Tax=Rhodamnia argentea TaxID=178133 RepID=A0A8B8QFV1_9MYRT|nr:pentatricopeptide repeat-containing protein At3g63370, chloroplastic isoform X2 [Rhodamnia argentea]